MRILSVMSLTGLLTVAACDDNSNSNQSNTTQPQSNTETQAPADPCAKKPTKVDQALCADAQLTALKIQVDTAQAKDAKLDADITQCEAANDVPACLEVAYKLALGRNEAAVTTQTAPQTVQEAVQETVNDTVNSATEAVQDKVNETVNDAINEVLGNGGRAGDGTTQPPQPSE